MGSTSRVPSFNFFHVVVLDEGAPRGRAGYLSPLVATRWTFVRRPWVFVSRWLVKNIRKEKITCTKNFNIFTLTLMLTLTLMPGVSL